MSRDEDIITAREADAVFERLSNYDHVLIAVSGGPDSTALLVLMSEWQGRCRAASPTSSWPTLSAATVDHGLRPQSAGEAIAVATLSATLGMPHTTLIWEGEKPASGLPNAARNARYALLKAHLEKLCANANCRAAILTAHTEDDQAETVLMRLARGGGIRALAGIPVMRTMKRDLGDATEIDIVRPLLVFPKHRLLATLHRRGVNYCEDPTNADMAFERPRIRAFLKTSGLEASALAQVASEMQSACTILEDVKRMLAEAMRIETNGGIYLRAERQPFSVALPLLQRELFRDLIKTYGGDTATPETAELDRAVARLLTNGNERGDDIRFTLGGAVVSAGTRYLRIWREPARIKDQALMVPPGATILWDQRFHISNFANEGLEIRALGPQGFAALKTEIGKGRKIPSAAAHGMPAIHLRGRLIAVPPLGYFAARGEETGAVKFACTPLLHPLEA